MQFFWKTGSEVVQQKVDTAAAVSSAKGKSRTSSTNNDDSVEKKHKCLPPKVCNAVKEKCLAEIAKGSKVHLANSPDQYLESEFRFKNFKENLSL